MKLGKERCESSFCTISCSSDPGVCTLSTRRVEKAVSEDGVGQECIPQKMVLRNGVGDRRGISVHRQFRSRLSVQQWNRAVELSLCQPFFFFF